MKTPNPITVETLVQGNVRRVWEYWTAPAHIMQWNHASDDWFCPYAENNVQVDGTFKFTMAAKDGSIKFDFEGTYTSVRPFERIRYTMADGRQAKIISTSLGHTTKITETFDPETANSDELQRQGRQSILDNFKKYVEAH